jgi:hypothetical protein
MKELDLNYDINVKDMIQFSRDIWIPENAGFEIIKSTFYDDNGNEVDMDILSDNNNKQIFMMKDGKFILEICDIEEVNYYYSENILDFFK